jgi:hypothetical protein
VKAVELAAYQLATYDDDSTKASNAYSLLRSNQNILVLLFDLKVLPLLSVWQTTNFQLSKGNITVTLLTHYHYPATASSCLVVRFLIFREVQNGSKLKNRTPIGTKSFSKDKKTSREA